MKTHTTNYVNTFIAVAEDCPVTMAEVPPQKAGEKSIALSQFEMIKENPYQYTSDEVLFSVYAMRNQIDQATLAAERQKFFSKGQPCFRASPLPKRYGWGVHSNEAAKIALYAIETEEYQQLLKEPTLQHTQAMRSKRG